MMTQDYQQEVLNAKEPPRKDHILPATLRPQADQEPQKSAATEKQQAAPKLIAQSAKSSTQQTDSIFNKGGASR